MKANRQEQRDNPQGFENPVLMAETLRNAAQAGDEAAKKSEEKGSAFWRILGGTVLSISAMVAVTLYQQLSSSLNEVRGNLAGLNTDMHKELSQLGQAQGGLVRKDEFTTRINSVWASIKDLQGMQTSVTGLHERSLVRDQQEKHDADVNADTRKELHQLAASVAVLKEQALRQEQRDKDQRERQDLLSEVQRLRERLAALEGRQGSAPDLKPASHAEEMPSAEPPLR